MQPDDVVHAATKLMHERFASLDDLPRAVANTIGNYCYQWALLTSSAGRHVYVATR
jgi:hypothetical protein